ncbi:MAG: carboxypeptidase regulatory-like domain-containing protein [Bacteroidia bacterium]
MQRNDSVFNSNEDVRKYLSDHGRLINWTKGYEDYSKGNCLISGTVIDKLTKIPLKGITVKITGTNQVVDSVKTDDSGYYFFDSTLVKPNNQYIVTIDGRRQGYYTNKYDKYIISTLGIAEPTIYKHDFEIEKEK